MRLLTVNSDERAPAAVAMAADWIRAGGIVAFPTDTFYGLAVDPCQPDAVQALFDLKGRDARMAIPLLSASLAQVEACCGALDKSNRRLARAFWPGPLSLILDAPSAIATAVHGGLGTIAVRVPGHPVARALAERCGYVITATSANVSGQAPVSDARGLQPLTHDSRLFVIDGGPTPGGAASTIVDARGTDPRLVRDGAVGWDRVLESLHA